jgi:hypothetical protein
MITLKTIKYDNACALEATWYDGETPLRSTAYSGDQMQLFRDDVAQYGGDIAEHEALIAEVEAEWVPPAPYVPTQEEINAENRAYLASTDWYIIRSQETGTPVQQDILDARSAARAAIV